MDILQMIASNVLRKTSETKKLEIPGAINKIYDVYEIPLDLLYYNDQNGRINTAYKKYKSEKGVLYPEAGDSEYNNVFEQFIYESNTQALDKTLESIIEKGQQESGVILPDGRVIDGNRRFTALRKQQKKDGIPKKFHAVVVSLDARQKNDEKTIKTLELDLQLGREEKISYDPIDRIFDVYNTIIVEKLMTIQEYRKASGAGNTKGINRDIRLAELILRFINIVSPGDNAIDRFYLARDLKLDGPMQEVEATLSKLESKDKESIIDSVLVYMAISKTELIKTEPKIAIRDLKNNVLNKPEMLQYFLETTDQKVDIILDSFEDNPVKKSNDLNLIVKDNEELFESAQKLAKSTEKLIYKGGIDTKRTRVVGELEEIRDKLEDINSKDFLELTSDENIEARDILAEINDILYRLKKDF